MDGRGRGTGTLNAARPRAAALRHAIETTAGFVPLPLRRATRQRTRQAIALFQGRARAPRHATSWLVVSVLGGAVAYGAGVSERYGPITDAMAATAGLAIADVRIEGALETTTEEIAEAAGIGRVRSLAVLDAEQARAAIVALPWVRTARVVKEYPGTLVVTVAERDAAAQWRVGASTLLLDDEGMPIVPSDGRALPLLVGEGADAAMDDGLALLKRAGGIASEFKALVRVGNRRWDAVTHRNIAVQLPSVEPVAALGKLTALHADQAVLDKELVSIDLRVPGRVALRLTAEAAELRAARVETAAKERRKARKLREAEL